MAVDEEEPAEAAPMVLEELSEEQAVDVVEQTMALDDGDDMEDVEQGPPAYSIVMDAPILAFPVATEQAQPTVFLVDEDDKMVGSSAVDDIADYEDTFDVEMYGSSPVLALQETLDVVPAITAISKFEVDKFLSTVPLPSAAVDVVVPDAPQPVSVAPPSSEEAFPEFVAPEACISGPEDAAHLAESAETSTAHKTREGKQRATPRETHVVEPKAALEAKADEFLSSIVLPPGAVDGATHESPQPAFVASGSSEDELPDYVEPEASMGGSVEAASAPYKVREGKQRADPRLMDEVDRSDDAVDGGNTETADDTAEEQDYREKNEVKDEAAKKPIVWVLSKSSLRVKRAPGELPRRDPVVDALAESLGRSSIVDPAA
ncbi:hypothetical protein B0H21DRAFT_205643 [Amylocystis lapponica]|nr:hypothetical protein B0H21DRAFT_205643 [Amylocystis lapponica]